MSNKLMAAVVIAFSVAGCASPTIILKSGKTWQAAKDRDGLDCIVVGSDGVKYPAKCKLNAGDLVLPAGSIK